MLFSGAIRVTYWFVAFASAENRRFGPETPFCVTRGTRSLAAVEEVLNKGAGKISINSPALACPDPIDDVARRFGT